MPEISVRQMNERQRRHYSLAARTFHATVIGSILIGLVAFVIGLGLYTYALTSQFISQSFQLARSTEGILKAAVDIEPLANDVMAEYRSMSEEERAGSQTEEYRKKFASFTKRADYQQIRQIMANFSGNSDMDALYLAMYDEETSAMVYIVDPDSDPKTVMMPVDWDPVTRAGMEKFLNWDGEGMLYDVENTDIYGWMGTSGVPVKNSSGETVAFVLADVTLDNVWTGMKRFTFQYVIAILISTFIIAYLMANHMKKHLVQPIDQIADAAQEYAASRKQGKRDTDFFEMLNIRTGDEVENLSLVLADMERDLYQFEENLTKVTAEKERISTELSLANKIQASMLPNIFPALPEWNEFDVYASMDPAKEVGGDFYDFFMIDDEHLCIVIADVSGKGIPAALFMMASQIMIRNHAMMGKAPSQILCDTNNAICANNREEMFVTVWIGILDINTGIITASSAGHEYPVITNDQGLFELFKDKHGMVVGGIEDAVYTDYELHMDIGSKLFVYTDGVPEATNAEQELFGTDRMVDALNKEPESEPLQILKNVRSAVDDFVQEEEQFDDLTMLCLQYNGPAGKQEA